MWLQAAHERKGKAQIAGAGVNYVESPWSEAAAWVEAIGAIAAVVGSGWVAARDSRAARGREERAEAAAERREARAVLAAKTAALNLAILAATQIRDLHVLLVDDAWRGRVDPGFCQPRPAGDGTDVDGLSDPDANGGFRYGGVFPLPSIAGDCGGNLCQS